LITQRETAPATAQAINLSLLKREASLELLALQTGEGGISRINLEEQDAHRLCSEVGDLPLALVLLGARLAERPDLRLAQLLADLLAKGVEAKALKQSHPELGAKLGVVEALLLSWEPLSEPAKSLGFLLSVIPPAVIEWKLVETCSLPAQEAEEGSRFGDQQSELMRTQFLERSGPGLYQVHPLVRKFLELQAQAHPQVTAIWKKQWRKALHARINSITCGRCIYCGAESNAVDCVLSSHEGCLDIIENNVPACYACNRAKGKSDPFAWYRSTFYYNPTRAMALRAWMEGDFRLAKFLLGLCGDPSQKDLRSQKDFRRL
jgi:hypothetical protein